MGKLIEIMSPMAPGSEPLDRNMARSSMLGVAPETPPTARTTTSPMITKASANNTRDRSEEPATGFAKLHHDPLDSWLPITESRNGNSLYAAFHLLNSGIGFQALFLPAAFTTLGFVWGIVCLSLAFSWQLFTLWLLIQLHESDHCTRRSRYLPLVMAAFGEKLGKLLALFPIMYLSGGTCTTLILTGGGALKTFFGIVCRDPQRCHVRQLTTAEWYVVFVCAAVVIALLPNLNSMAGVSLIGAIAAVGYCTMIWAASIAYGRPLKVSLDSPRAHRVFDVFNAVGIVALAFRGHNLALEIQGTMPSTDKHPSRVPMWRGVRLASLTIACCLFPLAICGYWAYGNLILSNGGLLDALQRNQSQKTSKAIIGLVNLLVVISCLSLYPIYGMPVFDNFEMRYASRCKRPCPRWVRSSIRVSFGGLTLFIAAALPFLPCLAGLMGGIALPVTLAYPCFMWLKMKKPKKYGLMWLVNWVLGVVGMVLSVLMVVGSIWSIATVGIPVRFFKPL